MQNIIKMIAIMVFLGTICFSFIMCSPIEQTSDILLINEYHVPIKKTIVGTGIRDLSISQGDSGFLTVGTGTHEICVITNDNMVSNTLKVIVVDKVVEIIILNANGKLVYKE